MHRVWFVSLAVMVLEVPAVADPTELGGWFGPRIFSADSPLGYIDGQPAHATLQSGIELGVRAAKQFALPWLYPEFELAVSPTKSSMACAMSPPTCETPVTVLWLEPRVQLRFELLPKRRLQPFLVVGGGSPLALSSARKTYATSITGDGYAGGGIRFDTRKNFTLRFDVRVAILPGLNPPIVTPEVEIGFGVEFAVGAPRVHATETVVGSATPNDQDGDGIPDDKDQCPDRPEDFDGFEDADGCPDIDNDNDHVLDIADKCPNVPETLNGYEDEDGCPDIVPADVDALRGTVEGLIYAEGETVVRDSALASIRNIAKVMKAHPGIKVVLVGHTDDREAKAFAIAPGPGQPPPDLDTLATELAHARAQAAREALVAAGIPLGRIVVEGVGAEDPVADNATAKGRLANRRVEIKLFVAR